MSRDWKAKWIGTEPGDSFQPVFFKDFYIEDQVKKATLFIAATGLFEAYINGRRIGDDFPSPFSVMKKESVPLFCYDVTDYLNGGPDSDMNSIDIFLGRGGKDDAAYALKAEIEIEVYKNPLQDGSPDDLVDLPDQDYFDSLFSDEDEEEISGENNKTEKIFLLARRGARRSRPVKTPYELVNLSELDSFLAGEIVKAGTVPDEEEGEPNAPSVYQSPHERRNKAAFFTMEEDIEEKQGADSTEQQAPEIFAARKIPEGTTEAGSVENVETETPVLSESAGDGEETEKQDPAVIAADIPEAVMPAASEIPEKKAGGLAEEIEAAFADVKKDEEELEIFDFEDWDENSPVSEAEEKEIKPEETLWGSEEAAAEPEQDLHVEPYHITDERLDEIFKLPADEAEPEAESAPGELEQALDEIFKLPADEAKPEEEPAPGELERTLDEIEWESLLEEPEAETEVLKEISAEEEETGEAAIEEATEAAAEPDSFEQRIAAFDVMPEGEPAPGELERTLDEIEWESLLEEPEAETEVLKEISAEEEEAGEAAIEEATEAAAEPDSFEQRIAAFDVMPEEEPAPEELEQALDEIFKLPADETEPEEEPAPGELERTLDEIEWESLLKEPEAETEVLKETSAEEREAVELAIEEATEAAAEPDSFEQRIAAFDVMPEEEPVPEELERALDEIEWESLLKEPEAETEVLKEISAEEQEAVEPAIEEAFAEEPETEINTDNVSNHMAEMDAAADETDRAAADSENAESENSGLSEKEEELNALLANFEFGADSGEDQAELEALLDEIEAEAGNRPAASFATGADSGEGQAELEALLDEIEAETKTGASIGPAETGADLPGTTGIGAAAIGTAAIGAAGAGAAWIGAEDKAAAEPGRAEFAAAPDEKEFAAEPPLAEEEFEPESELSEDAADPEDFVRRMEALDADSDADPETEELLETYIEDGPQEEELPALEDDAVSDEEIAELDALLSEIELETEAAEKTEIKEAAEAAEETEIIEAAEAAEETEIIIIATDETWNYNASDIEESLPDGCEIFNRLLWEGRLNPEKGVVPAAVDLTLEEADPLPVRKETIPVREILYTPEEEPVLDFGQIFTGFVAFDSTLPKGTKVELTFAENWKNGRPETGDPGKRFVFISDGIPEVVMPHFTCFRGRYVRITGWEGELKAENFTAYALYADLEQTGYIETSDAGFNRKWEELLREQKQAALPAGNGCGAADVSGAASAMEYNWNVKKYLTSCLERAKRNEQGDQNARTAGQIWDLYQMYGDEEILSDHYDLLTSWVRRIDEADGAQGEKEYLYDPSPEEEYWITADPETESAFLASACYYDAVRISEEAARVLGKEQEASRFRRLSRRIRQAFLDEYFTSSGRLALDTQSAYVLALCFGLYIDKAGIQKAFLNRLKKDGGRMNCGPLAAPYFCDALAECGRTDLAYEIMLDPESKEPAHEIGFLYRRVAGIEPAEPGFSSVRLAPLPDGRLRSCTCSFRTAYGEIVSNWKLLDSGDLSFHFEIPEGVTARIALPYYPVCAANGNEVTVKHGSYDYSYMPDIRLLPETEEDRTGF